MVRFIDTYVEDVGTLRGEDLNSSERSTILFVFRVFSTVLSREEVDVVAANLKIESKFLL